MEYTTERRKTCRVTGIVTVTKKTYLKRFFRDTLLKEEVTYFNHIGHEIQANGMSKDNFGNEYRNTACLPIM